MSHSHHHCGGANDGRTPNLGCTQEPRRKAAYCIDAAVCAGKSKRGKGRKGRIGGIGCGRGGVVLEDSVTDV